MRPHHPTHPTLQPSQGAAPARRGAAPRPAPPPPAAAPRRRRSRWAAPAAPASSSAHSSGCPGPFPKPWHPGGNPMGKPGNQGKV